jgi:hypothetical protein
MLIIRAEKTKKTLEEVNKILSDDKEFLKKEPVVLRVLHEYGFKTDIIDGIPMKFSDDLDVSAKTINSSIELNTSLLDESTIIRRRYEVHELVHALQHMRNEGKKNNNADEQDYLRDENEVEAFQNQIEFDSKYRGENEAEEYVEDLVEYHEVPEHDREEIKEELLERA